MSSAGEVLLPEIRGKLDGQLGSLESARTRAAVALTASGVVAGLFAQRLGTLAHPTITGFQKAALVAFVIGGFGAVYVMWPHKLKLWPKGKPWSQFATANAEWLRKALAADPTTVDHSGEQLAAIMCAEMLEWYEDNKPVLGWVQKALSATWLAMAAQVVFWALSVLRF